MDQCTPRLDCSLISKTHVMQNVAPKLLAAEAEAADESTAPLAAAAAATKAATEAAYINDAEVSSGCDSEIFEVGQKLLLAQNLNLSSNFLAGIGRVLESTAKFLRMETNDGGRSTP